LGSPLIKTASTFGKQVGLEAVIAKSSYCDRIFHDLRATCITEWFERGMMPHEVQKLAGHASIDTTMKYYVGIRESMIDRARGASAAALGCKSVASYPKEPKWQKTSGIYYHTSD
jgi:integrase